MKTVSAREANQQFSRLLAEAEAGEEVVITRRGKAVAVLRQWDEALTDVEREAKIARAIEIMREGFPLAGRRFSREEMHER